jgi:hypothetical protein
MALAMLPLPPQVVRVFATSHSRGYFDDSIVLLQRGQFFSDGTPGPEHSYIVDDWITEGGKCVIGGASLSGKSFLAVHMAMCISTGNSFFQYKVILPGLVIYQAGEGETGIRKRFRAWRQHFGIKKGQEVPLYIIEQKIDIFNPNADTGPFIDEIEGIRRTYNVPLRAIVIDTLAKASIGADENSGRDMGVVLANVDRISSAFPKASTGLVHHLNAGGTKLRGHTSLYANVDQVILVTNDEEKKIRTATLDKQKDGESGLGIPFELMQVEVGKRQIDGRAITSCVVLPIGGKLEARGEGKARDRSISLSDDQTNIFRALQEAINEVGIPTPPALKLPRSIVKVCTVTDWYNAYRAVASKEDAAIRKAMGRASDRFLKLRVIGRINPYVWITNRVVADLLVIDAGSIAGGHPIQEEFPEQGDIG